MRAGEASPVDLMTDVIARGDRAESQLNPFTARYGEEAMAAALDAERRYRDGSARPLEGIPVAVKELTPVAGVRRWSVCIGRRSCHGIAALIGLRRVVNIVRIVVRNTAAPHGRVIGGQHRDH